MNGTIACCGACKRLRCVARGLQGGAQRRGASRLCKPHLGHHPPRPPNRASIAARDAAKARRPRATHLAGPSPSPSCAPQPRARRSLSRPRRRPQRSAAATCGIRARSRARGRRSGRGLRARGGVQRRAVGAGLCVGNDVDTGKGWSALWTCPSPSPRQLFACLWAKTCIRRYVHILLYRNVCQWQARDGIFIHFAPR